MKEIQLVHGKVALIDDEDFGSASRFKWRLDGGGYVQTIMDMGYIAGKRMRVTLSLHRLIIRPPKGFEVDHRNHDILDCRRANLRVCTRSQNLQNRVKRKGKSSKFKGVYWHKGAAKWDARITHNGKKIYFGLFQDETAAAKAYDAKAKELFGEFAHVNF